MTTEEHLSKIKHKCEQTLERDQIHADFYEKMAGVKDSEVTLRKAALLSTIALIDRLLWMDRGSYDTLTTQLITAWPEEIL